MMHLQHMPNTKKHVALHMNQGDIAATARGTAAQGALQTTAMHEQHWHKTQDTAQDTQDQN